jgi:uncharacterized protein (TIGR03435 family)
MKVFALILAIACVSPAATQTSFDVISIKPSRGGRDFPTATGGRLHARYVSVQELIAMAYQLPPFQLSGGPAWLESERFDIDAKSDTPADAAQTRLMVQALLADRFQFKFHRETKETQAYALVVPAGKTTKLVAADKTGCEAEPSATNPCQQFRSQAGFVLVAERLSMPLFVKVLSSLFRNTVIDKTVLDGVYSFTLDLGKAGFVPTPGSPTNEMDGMNAVMSGLQDQLGLKLERTKTSTEIIVIDHIEKPSGN